MSISQSDLVLIKALTEGLAYLRRNPWQLDYVFQDVTASNLNVEFGREEIQRAKKWFLKTEIPVFGVYRLDKPIYPCITVSVLSSNESEAHAALGEIDPMVFPEDETVNKQDLVSVPDMIEGPFSPSYDITTGIVTIPDEFSTELIFVNQGLYSQTSNTTYQIQAILSDKTFLIDKGIRDNLTNSFITPAYNVLKVMRHIANFKEQYEINCCIKGTPGELYWLHAITTYVLLQRRQYLLEKYNIGLSNLSSGEMVLDEAQSPENFFQRRIIMTGMAEVRWVDCLSEYLEGVIGEINLVKSGDTTVASTLET
ncbi:MAG TPA: hypothetical protein VK590_07460 [Saprospiraceae bacterium]|nr:hypothetical protein [Saprospiraceae bacterium]